MTDRAKETNPVVTLKTQLEKFDHKKLQADEKNAQVSSGKVMYNDIDRMDFIINEKEIDSRFIVELKKGAKKCGFDKVLEEHCKHENTSTKQSDLYKQELRKFYDTGEKYSNLIPSNEDGNYRPFVKEVFKEMFRYAGVQIPNDAILEELITGCNQAGYVGALYGKGKPVSHLSEIHELMPSSIHTTHINCSAQDNVIVKSNEIITIRNKYGKEICKFDSLLEFTLESKDNENVTYKDGELSIILPEELKNYSVVNEMQQNKSLFDVIKEFFSKLAEKLFGHTSNVEVTEECGVTTMTSNLGKSLKVKSNLKKVEPPINTVILSK